MVEDTADFADTEYIQETAQGTQRLDVDLSDLLAELESINVKTAVIQSATLLIDLPLRYRSGSPLYFTQFEHGAAHWQGTVGDTDGSSAISTTLWLSKGQAWALKADAGGTKYARMEARFGSYPKCKVALEAAFTLTAQMTYLYWLIKWVDGDNDYLATLYYKKADDAIKLRDHQYAVKTVLSNWTPDVDDSAFHFIKLIIDVTTGKYVTLYLDEHEIPLADHGLFPGTGATGEPIYIAVQLNGAAGQNPIIYVDDVCLIEED